MRNKRSGLNRPSVGKVRRARSLNRQLEKPNHSISPSDYGSNRQIAKMTRNIFDSFTGQNAEMRI